MPNYEKFGKYLLLEELSTYYFGKSYRAAGISEKGLEQNVILLKINHDLSRNTEFIQNLQAEIAVCTELNGANVLKTLGMGKAENTFYITRQYIPGQPLKNVLQKCALKEIPFSVDHALFVASRLCHTLEYTHSHQVNGRKVHHGNLSTTSIILSYDGSVNLSGFGLTSILYYLPEWKERILLRKDEYLSPEQMAGRQIDHRSDIFTAGVILFEMLTGDPFFLPGRGVNFKTRIDSIKINRSDRDKDEIPDEVIQVLSKSIVNDPDGRYQDIKEMRIDLETGLITNNFHASKTTLALFLDSIFREEIVEITERVKLEHQMDIASYTSAIAAKGKEERASPAAESRKTSRDAKAVPRRAESPELQKTKSDFSIPGRSIVARMVTPLLVAGLTVIILLIVFYFINGMRNSDSGMPITNSFKIRGGEETKTSVWERIGTGADNESERRLRAEDFAVHKARNIRTSQPPETGSAEKAIPGQTPKPIVIIGSERQNIKSRTSTSKGLHGDMAAEASLDETAGTRESVHTGIGDRDSENAGAPVSEAEETPSSEPENGEAILSEDQKKEHSDTSSTEPESTWNQIPPPGDSSEAVDASRDVDRAMHAAEQQTGNDPVPGEPMSAVPVAPPTPTPIIEPPVLSKAGQPRYSSLAQQLNIAGTLQIDILVSEKGQVLDVQVPDTPQNQALDKAGVVQAVVQAARKWKFTPATQNGQPVEQWLRINYKVTTE